MGLKISSGIRHTGGENMNYPVRSYAEMAIRQLFVKLYAILRYVAADVEEIVFQTVHIRKRMNRWPVICP